MKSKSQDYNILLKNNYQKKCSKAINMIIKIVNILIK